MESSASKILKDILIYVCIFFLLLYPFNATIVGIIYKPLAILKFTIIISVFLLYILLLKPKDKISRNMLLIIIGLIIFFCFILIKNWDIKKESYLKPILYISYALLIPLYSLKEELFNKTLKVIKLFGFEHIFFTYFGAIFKTQYIAHILPILDSISVYYKPSDEFLRRNINMGITTHYSSNGMYLSIITILFFSEYIANKNKKSLIMSIISLGALFITGKRGHTIFTIIACILEFLLIKKENFLKKNIKLIAGISALLIVFYFASAFIPALSNAFNRINESSSEGDILSGRDIMYDLAISIWKSDKLFGKGWGYYKYAYDQKGMESIFGFPLLDSHDIYLQLLSEVGLFGFAFFMYIFSFGLIQAAKNSKINNLNVNEKTAIDFSFTYLLFFLLYGISGNPLYDAQCYSIYFMLYGITLYFWKNKKNINNNISK